jgi:hypothetical protein
LTALEYNFKRWRIYHYNHDKLSPFFADEDLKEMNLEDLITSITTREDGLKDINVIDDNEEITSKSKRVQ